MNVATNGLGLLNALTSGDVAWDAENLSPVFSGGKLYDTLGLTDNWNIQGQGAHTLAFRTKSLIKDMMHHEVNHLWHSRIFGNQFALNFGNQALYNILSGTNAVNQIGANYFEYMAKKVWNY